MLTQAEVEEILVGERELRNFEVKGPGSRSDNAFAAKVIRAALSMGNLRDGGHVLIGINDERLGQMEPGMCDEEIATWMAVDDVARKFAEYSDPPLVLELAQRELGSGAHVVLIEVSEFADIPHLCARQYNSTLVKGALYVRSRGVAETVVVADPVEMREVLDLATEKALRRFIETTQRSGLELSPSSRESDADALLFDRQRAQAFE